MPSTLHLISGLPAAGKSTYARQLRSQRGAVLLVLDHWLITAYGKYPVGIDGHDEHLRRVHACRDLIWEVAAEFLHRGFDVILDDGFFLRDDRMHHIERASAIGVPTSIHYINVDDDELRARVEARNRQPGDKHFEITAKALDVYIAFFQPPSTDEGAELVVVTDRD